MEWIVTTGDTVEQAKDRALDQLSVAPEDAEFIVVQEATTKLFGLRKISAEVRARVRPVAPAPKQEYQSRRRGRDDKSRSKSRSGGDISGGAQDSKKSRSEKQESGKQGSGKQGSGKQGSGRQASDNEGSDKQESIRGRGEDSGSNGEASHPTTTRKRTLSANSAALSEVPTYTTSPAPSEWRTRERTAKDAPAANEATEAGKSPDSSATSSPAARRKRTLGASAPVSAPAISAAGETTEVSFQPNADGRPAPDDAARYNTDSNGAATSRRRRTISPTGAAKAARNQEQDT
jgi:hypothetical protein